jgi:hypothetical protein
LLFCAQPPDNVALPGQLSFLPIRLLGDGPPERTNCELEEPYQLTFGKDGKPFFISGPYDNVERIIKQLDKTAGPGNYDVVINLR